MSHNDNLIAADELMKLDLPEPRWLIEGMLPEGMFAILAGKPKTGKSWLALQMACAIEKGADFWGRKTLRTRVDYYALEDCSRRIQGRLKIQGQNPSSALFFGWRLESIGNQEGVDALRLRLLERKCGLCIIDTWGTAMGKKVDENEAKHMAPLMGEMRVVAQQTGCTILLVMHHSKIASGDAVYDIRGSSAIGGAADVIYGIYRKRGDMNGGFTATGREIEEIDIPVRFDTTTRLWLVKDAEQAQTTEDAILEIVNQTKGVTANDVAKMMGMSKEGARKILLHLTNEGAVEKHLAKNGRSWAVTFQAKET